MLHFILGGSGSGKSEYIRQVFCRHCADGDEKLLLLVPDQSSFEAEKLLLQTLGAKAMRRIKIFGFARLCDYVLEHCGKTADMPLESSDLPLITSVALDEVSDLLTVFGKRKNTDDFIETLTEAVEEYRKCGVSPAQLRSAAAKTQDLCTKRKLADSALIYEAFEAVLRDKYTDPIRKLEIAQSCIAQANPFAGWTVAVDSFSNFTSAEYGILSVILRDSSEMYVALTLDPYGEDRDNLFFTANLTYRRISALAKENGTASAPPVLLLENRRTDVPELVFLERNIFRTRREIFDREVSAVEIYTAPTIYDECEFAASEIKRLIVSEGCVLSDFAILMRNGEKYDEILQTTLKKYGLRFFDDRRENVSDKPLIKLIFYIFDSVLSGFDPQSVLQILKTGLTPISLTQTAEFENYLYCRSIDSKQIKNKFTKNPNSMNTRLSSQEQAQLDRIENVRSFVMTALIEFREKCKDANAEEITGALYELLLALHCDECLLSLSEKYRSLGSLQLAEAQTRLWDSLMHSFDKIAMIIGGKKLSLKRYSRLLQLQLANADMGFIPQGQDLITVGSAERTKLSGIKTVFILGAVEGEFPRSPGESGIFSDNERRCLLNLGLNLDYSCEDVMKQERFVAYSSLTSACRKLYISCYSHSLSGELYSPSSIITQTQEMFPKLTISRLPMRFMPERKLYSQQAAFELCAKRFGKSDALSSQLLEHFSENENYSHKIAAVERALSKKQDGITDKSTVKQLFGDNLTLSASQIEKFYGCRFAYLCRYGLKIKERRRLTVDALEYGSFMHYILQMFFSFIKNHPDIKADRELVNAETEKYIDLYLSEKLGGSDDKDERFGYLLTRIKETAQTLILHILEEFEQSRFTPEFFEYKIGADGVSYVLTLDSGETVSINGSIDRVDIMNGGNARYVRIIDYKTNSKQFNLYDILYGLNMQMLLYLSAVCKNTDMRPAGILYMPAIEPIVNAETPNPAEIEKKREKEMTMNGLILDRTEVITGMEADMAGRFIPVSAKSRNNGKSLISDKQFEQIFSYLDTKITDMAENIYSGKFPAVPLKGANDSCEWCPYGDVCGFSENDQTRFIQSAAKEEVLNEIEKDTKGR